MDSLLFVCLVVCLISALSCQCFLQLATGLLPGNSSMVFGTGLLDPGSLGLPKMVSVVSHAAMQLVVFRLLKKDWCSHWSCCIPGRKWSGLCLSCWKLACIQVEVSQGRKATTITKQYQPIHFGKCKRLDLLHHELGNWWSCHLHLPRSHCSLQS